MESRQKKEFDYTAAGRSFYERRPRQYIVQVPVVIFVRRRNGETPAHGAAMHGHVATLKRLKELGCDLNALSYKMAADQHGAPYEPRTPLDYARYYYQSEAADYLVSQGCTTSAWSEGKPWMA